MKVFNSNPIRIRLWFICNNEGFVWSLWFNSNSTATGCDVRNIFTFTFTFMHLTDIFIHILHSISISVHASFNLMLLKKLYIYLFLFLSIFKTLYMNNYTMYRCIHTVLWKSVCPPKLFQKWKLFHNKGTFASCKRIWLLLAHLLTNQLTNHKLTIICISNNKMNPEKHLDSRLSHTGQWPKHTTRESSIVQY